MSSSARTDVLAALNERRQRCPNQTAVVVYAARQSREQGRLVERDRVTTAELWDRVIAMAAGLRARGLRQGDIMAVQLPNWAEYLVLFLAVYAIGGVTTPISPILRQRDVRRQLEIAGAKGLVVPAAFGNFDYLGMARDLQAELEFPLALAANGDATSDIMTIEAVEREGAAPTLSHERDAIARGEFIGKRTDVMIVNFTSGTSGQPKGVMHSMHSVGSCVMPTIERLQLTPDSVIMVVPTLGHGAGILNGLYLPMLLGATVVYLDGWDAEVALRVVEREQVSYAPLMPTYLVDISELPWPLGVDVSCWTTGRVSGSAIPRETLQRIASRMPQLRLCPGWGMSETFWATCGGPADPIDKRNGTDGSVVGDCRIEIRDKQMRHALPTGTVGEIVLKASSLTLGYYKQPELTRSAFTADGWFKTGDLGRLDEDGYLVVQGRSKDLVIRGGENVPVVEVESLLQEHPKVKAVAVVGVPDARLGEKVCAVVELHDDGDPLTLQEMAQHLMDRHLTKQFIPEHLVIVPALPRTPVGKIMKQSVREHAARSIAGR